MAAARERRVPRRLDEARLQLHHGCAETVVAVDGFEVEAAAVAEPTPVHRVGVDALVAQHLVAARLHHGAAADRTRGAGRLLLVEVPRSGLEPVRLGGERADRADLHGVAGEVRRERLVGERDDLGVVAAADEVDELVAGHLVGEAGAAVAEDAALAVEEHEIADRDRLLVVTLLLDVPALARAVAERLVLQRALAALVAHRAVERVVGEQQLEHALLRALDLIGVGVDHLAVGDRGHARHDHHRPPWALDLDHALAAHADRVHPRVVAEVRDVLVGAERRGDDHVALASGHGTSVDRQRHRVGVGFGRRLDDLGGLLDLLGLRGFFDFGVVAHSPTPDITGMLRRSARLVTSAANSSGNRVMAEWIGT